MESKFKSRKFLISQEIIVLGIALPLLFHYVGIVGDVTLMALGVVSGAGTLYGVVSTWDKKNNCAGGQ